MYCSWKDLDAWLWFWASLDIRQHETRPEKMFQWAVFEIFTCFVRALTYLWCNILMAQTGLPSTSNCWASWTFFFNIFMIDFQFNRPILTLTCWNSTKKIKCHFLFEDFCFTVFTEIWIEKRNLRWNSRNLTNSYEFVITKNP